MPDNNVSFSSIEAERAVTILNQNGILVNTTIEAMTETIIKGYGAWNGDNASDYLGNIARMKNSIEAARQSLEAYTAYIREADRNYTVTETGNVDIMKSVLDAFTDE